MRKIRIYQLNGENEVARNLMFTSYKWAKKYLSLDLYKMVWEGEVDDESTLDDIYHQFNVNRPADFKGHSLSISDLVEENGEYYYCDSYGWEEVTFPTEEKTYCVMYTDKQSYLDHKTIIKAKDAKAAVGMLYRFYNAANVIQVVEEV